MIKKGAHIRSGKNPLSLAKRDRAGRRILPIDLALRWAFCDELPKAPPVAGGPMALRTGYGSILDYGELGTVIDQGSVNRYGCIADLSSDAFAHEDAIVLGDAVLALEDLELDIPADWNPAPELDHIGPLASKCVSEALRSLTSIGENGSAKLRISPRDMVIRRAVLPVPIAEMQLEDVELKFQKHANGKDRWYVQMVQHEDTGATDGDGQPITRQINIEVNGTDKNGRTLPDAYRKPYLDPDPREAIIARAEHEIWYAALMILLDDFDLQMDETVLAPPSTSVRPWLDPIVPEPRIHTNRTAEKKAHEARLAALRAYNPQWFKRLEARERKRASGLNKAVMDNNKPMSLDKSV